MSAALLTPGAISEAAILREPLIADGFVKYLPEHIVGTLQSMFWLRLLLVLVLPGIWTPACADILSAYPRVGQYMVGSRLQYLEDVNSKLAIRDVVSPYWQNKFRPNHRDVPNFGFTQSSYWFKLSLSNPASTPEAWILEARYPMLDRVDAYLVRKGVVVGHKVNGDLLPFNQREFKHRHLGFKLDLAAYDQLDVYLRVKTESSLQLPLQLLTPEHFLERDQAELYLLGLYYGVLLAMLAYNLLIYSAIRDINYLHYVHYLAGYAMFQLSLNGLTLQYLWPQHPAWGNTATPFFIGVAFLGAVTFARSFLHLKTQAPLLDSIGKLLWGVFLFVIVGSLWLPYPLMIQLATMAALATAVYAFFSGLVVWRGQLRQARYFLLAWSALLIGIMLYSLKTFNLLPSMFITEYSLQIGSALEVLLLSFALAHRMKILQLDYTRIQEEAKGQLEQRVSQRTAELDEALKKLSDANSKLRSLNFTDGLTGVRNRRYFDQKLRKEWERAQRGGYFITVMLIDLDFFKKINDTYGHQAGDMCLKSVSLAIKTALKRPCDIVARYGGEEFVVILPLTDEAGALHIAESIRQEVAALAIVYEGWRINLTTSIGLCTAKPDETLNPNDVIAAADAALYKAKHNGRNQVQTAEPGQTPAGLPETAASVAGH